MVTHLQKQKRLRAFIALLKAFNQKIVAIALTILSTVLGLIPIVWGGQTEVFWFAFASGAIGGLIFSMVAILLYLPLFLRMERFSSDT